MEEEIACNISEDIHMSAMNGVISLTGGFTDEEILLDREEFLKIARMGLKYYANHIEG